MKRYWLTTTLKIARRKNVWTEEIGNEDQKNHTSIYQLVRSSIPLRNAGLS